MLFITTSTGKQGRPKDKDMDSIIWGIKYIMFF